MAIFLDPVPSYNATGGIKAYIDREPDFFTSSDTTKVAGIDPLCQDYLWLKPSYEYCRDHDKKNAERLFRDMNLALQRAEARLLGDKTKDIPRRIIPVFSNNR
jgi:predicted oxidoreductase